MRLSRFWSPLTGALHTGQPQNKVKTGRDFFATLYADPQRLEVFIKAMIGLSVGSAQIIAKMISWKKYGTLVHVGCSQGGLAEEIALRAKI